MYTILIVDDDATVRNSLCLRFAQSPDFDVVGTAENGQQALHWLSAHSCDIMLSDLRMPAMDGLTLLSEVQKLKCPPRFVGMTAFDTDDTMLKVLKRGGCGYIIKWQQAETIMHTLREVMQGGTILSPMCITRLINSELSKTPIKSSNLEPLSSLELDVLKRVCKGMANKEIAADLNYSESTIKQQVSRLLKQLNARSRSKLIAEYAPCFNSFQ